MTNGNLNPNSAAFVFRETVLANDAAQRARAAAEMAGVFAANPNAVVVEPLAVNGGYTVLEAPVLEV